MYTGGESPIGKFLFPTACHNPFITSPQDGARALASIRISFAILSNSSLFRYFCRSIASHCISLETIQSLIGHESMIDQPETLSLARPYVGADEYGR